MEIPTHKHLQRGNLETMKKNICFTKLHVINTNYLYISIAISLRYINLESIAANKKYNELRQRTYPCYIFLTLQDVETESCYCRLP